MTTKMVLRSQRPVALESCGGASNLLKPCRAKLTATVSIMAFENEIETRDYFEANPLLTEKRGKITNRTKVCKKQKHGGMF